MNVPFRGGFTLVELLAVIAIIAIAFGMIAFMPKQDQRDVAVQAAAEELAATLRLARAMAIDKRCLMGVSFNIQNGAGSSGQQINNWSGQHWYRIIGPSVADYQNTEDQLKTWAYPTYPIPNLYPWGLPLSSLGNFSKKIGNAWIGDRHRLKAHAVRLVALDDQDNGACLASGGSTSFAATYPRPWCGYWDPAAKRLYPWGGYDHAIANSGFGYEGSDGAITGCVNPASRTTLDGQAFPIFSQGQERPLINGEWLDYLMVFLPDGSAQEGRYSVTGAYGLRMNVLTARYSSLFGDGVGKGSNIGDLLKGSTSTGMPMASFMPFTGCWSITLGPDLDQDMYSYPDALSAIRSLQPLYRVQVGPLGGVHVLKVSNSSPAGAVMDPTAWQAQPGKYYQNGLPSNSDGSRRTVYPEDAFLFPSLPQQHWRTSP